MSLANKPVSELMSQPVHEVEPEARVGQVLELAKAENVHHFPVVRSGALIGLVCTCDLDDVRRDTKIQELLGRSVVTVARETPLRSAAEAMARSRVGSILVVKGSYACGIVTREDAQRHAPELARLFEDQRCSCCGALKHLRAWHDDELLCASCLLRARDSSSAELGGGD